MPTMRRLLTGSYLGGPRLGYADRTRNLQHRNVGDPREHVSLKVVVVERSVVLPSESRTSGINCFLEIVDSIDFARFVTDASPAAGHIRNGKRPCK